MPNKRVYNINPTLASQESSCPPLYSPNWGPLGIPVFPVTAHPPPSTKGPTLKPTTGKLSRCLPPASYLQGICFLVETTQPLSTFHNTLFRQRCPLKPAHHSTIKRETMKRTRGLPKQWAIVKSDIILYYSICHSKWKLHQSKRKVSQSKWKSSQSKRTC